MKIYTKFGDQGETRLGNGRTVKKDDLRIEAYGNLDELNSLLGLCAAKVNRDGMRDLLLEIQNKIFSISAIVANPKLQKSEDNQGGIQVKKDQVRLTFEEVTFLEERIDALESELTQLTSFILPGGSEGAALLHLARTVCRRSERAMVALDRESALPKLFSAYINRLSDLLFVMARVENAAAGIEDKKWS